MSTYNLGQTVELDYTTVPAETGSLVVTRPDKTTAIALLGGTAGAQTARVQADQPGTWLYLWQSPNAGQSLGTFTVGRQVSLAGLADVQARFPRLLTDDETSRATVLLDDATAIVLASYPSAATSPVALQVVANMVKRALLGSGPEGIKAEAETVGPFSTSVTYDNPTGGLYLTAADRVLLGGPGRPNVGSMRLARPLW